MNRGSAGRRFALLAASAVMAACATTTGPPVSAEEEASAILELRERARLFRLDRIGKLWDLGYRLIAVLPASDSTNAEPFIGFLTSDAIPEDARPRALARADSGVVVAHVVTGSAAERAGLERGDAVVRLNGRRVRKGLEIHETVSKLGREGRGPVEVQLQIVDRDGGGRVLAVRPDVPKRYVPFAVIPEDVVNAGTDGRSIGVTRGMIRFVKSDDELAVVLGHELAHITRDHLEKRLGRALGWAIAGALVSAFVGLDVSDVTDLAVAVVESKYNRDQEREADYFGLLYANEAGFDVRGGVTIWERFAIELPASMVKNLFGSHPTSAERMVRARKYADLVAAGRADTTVVPPDTVP